MNAERKQRVPDWTPRRKGKLFCSPSCGAGCTRKAYDEATAAAHKLARAMGPGWEPVVWENCAWHYKVVSPCQRVNLHINGPTSFTAGFGKKGSTGSYYIGRGRTPRAALRRMLASVKENLDEIGAAITEPVTCKLLP